MLAPRKVPARNSAAAVSVAIAEDLDGVIGKAVDCLARRELGIGVDHARAAFGLGQHDGIGARGHDCIEIGVDQSGRDGVDAHQEARAVGRLASFLEEVRGAFSGGDLAFRRDRVLEVDDHGVGAARHGLVELVAAVGRHEEKGAHYIGRMRMKTWRRHSATSLLF